MGPSPAPSHVFLDLGGVVFPSPFGALEKGTRVAKAKGLNVDLIKLLRAERTAWGQLERGEIVVEQWVRHVAAKAVPDSDEATEKHIEAALTDFLAAIVKSRPEPMILHVLTEIRGRYPETKIVAITNNFSSHTQKELKQLSIDKNPTFGGPRFVTDLLGRPLFDDVIESWVEGCRKGDGDKKIFKVALRRAGLDPENFDSASTLFCDDLKPNVEEARSIGLNAVRTPNPEAAFMALCQAFNIPASYFPRVVWPRKGFELDASLLEKYLQKELNLPAKRRLAAIEMFSFGQSNPTYFLRWKQRADDDDVSRVDYGKCMVLRKKPPGQLVASAHNVEREWRIMRALRGSGVPVPETLAFCKDAAVVGTEFALTAFVQGIAYKSPSMEGVAARGDAAAKEYRRKVYVNLIRTLAKIHDVDLGANEELRTVLGVKGAPSEFCRGYTLRQVKRWAGQVAQNEDVAGASEVLALARELQGRLEVQGKWGSDTFYGLTHGDFRLDNVLVDETTGEIKAVLDWELSAAGAGLVDVCSALGAHPISPLGGVNPNGSLKDGDGVPTYEELLETYAAARARIAGAAPTLNGPAFGPETQKLGLSQSTFRVYTAAQMFRLCGILHGIVVRRARGTASGDGSNNPLLTSDGVIMLAGGAQQLLSDAPAAKL